MLTSKRKCGIIIKGYFAGNFGTYEKSNADSDCSGVKTNS